MAQQWSISLIKVNIKLKMAFESIIRKPSHQNNEMWSIYFKPQNSKKDIVERLISYFLQDSYFLYKEGNTKFNGDLQVVSRLELSSYLKKNGYIDYQIFDINSLSELVINYEDTFVEENKVLDNVFMISANGIFQTIVKKLSNNFDLFDYPSVLPTNN